MAMTQQPIGVPAFADFHQKALAARQEEFIGRAHTQVASAAAFSEMQTHIANLYDGVEVQHSFVDDNGQIFDCIPFEQQHAVKNSATPIPPPPVPPVPPGGFAGPPATVLQPLLAGRQDRFGNDIACPPGTVPIRRLTLGELTRSPTLREFFSKESLQTSGHAIETRSSLGSVADGTHRYAHGLQDIPNVGGRTVLTVYSPVVTDDQEFSLAQLWYVGDGPGVRQTVEVGWHVMAPKFGKGSLPRLFTYWTRDNYQNTGSYDTDGGQFILAANAPIAPGMTLSPSSVVGGAQVELDIIVALIQPNWWIYIGRGGAQPQAIGCYPVSIYNDGPLATGATTIDYGGETDGITSHPAMGSGRFGSAGRGQAAYHRNISFVTPTGEHQSPQLFGSDPTPTEYDFLLDSTDDFAPCVFFGGPGGP